MANTYFKIYLHIVFATKNRESAIPPIHEKRIHSYMAGIIKKCGHHPIKIGGTDNHVHILISYNANHLLPDLVRDLKSSTSKFINDEKMVKCKFAWQTGYACISYSQSHIEAAKRYIASQHEHHHNMTLEDEVKKMLERYRIEYNPEYIIGIYN